MTRTSSGQAKIGPGIFISFEGIDGAGKSSHIEPLAQAFEQLGHEVLRTREPGGTPLAEQLRQMVLSDPMDPLTEALLVFAARRDHLKTVIAPALAAGKVVISDRFTDSTFAYQGGGRGFDLRKLHVLEQFVQDSDMLVQAGRAALEGQLLRPDLTLLFYLDPAIASGRLAGARTPDRFESESRAFFQAVSQGYMARYRADSERFALVQASKPREEVWVDVQRIVEARGLLVAPSNHSDPADVQAQANAVTL